MNELDVTVMAKAHGYAATKEQLLVRLARAEGQVRGVARMVHEDRDCIDILTQVSAIHAALDKVSLGLLDRHARDGMTSDPEIGPQVDELVGAVERMLLLDYWGDSRTSVCVAEPFARFCQADL